MAKDADGQTIRVFKYTHVSLDTKYIGQETFRQGSHNSLVHFDVEQNGLPLELAVEICAEWSRAYPDRYFYAPVIEVSPEALRAVKRMF